jgi:hypothetical protein
MCVCGLSYPACKAHAPYCQLWPAPLYSTFPHYLKNGKILGVRHLFNTKFDFWFSPRLLSETFLILRRTERDVIVNVRTYSCKVALLLSDFNETWTVTDFGNNTQTSNSIKIGPEGAELFRAHRQTDITKLTAACRNFTNASNNSIGALRILIKLTKCLSVPSH